MKHNQGSSDL